MSISSIQVTPACQDPAALKCPRCWRWHKNGWNTEYPPDKPDEFAGRHRFCDRCEETLMGMAQEGSGHEAALKCRANGVRLGRITL